MRAELRDGDTLARLSGDEFVVVCDDLPATDDEGRQRDVDAVQARLRRALAPPVRLGDVDVVVSASTGVAHSGPGSTAEELLSEADTAMYRAKHPAGQAAGTGGSLRDLERQLTRALPEGRLRLHHQPIVDAGGTVRAVEALLRWQHPTRGLLPAAEFVDLAEHCGMVVAFGRWVAEEACAHLARWRSTHGPAAPETVYVNLSARELADPGLGGVLQDALERNGLVPGDLGLELLESSFIDPLVLPALHELQRRGHPLSIDDFGTGYSSLARLVDLPVRMAKVDKSLVAGIASDPRAGPCSTRSSRSPSGSTSRWSPKGSRRRRRPMPCWPPAATTSRGSTAVYPLPPKNSTCVWGEGRRAGRVDRGRGPPRRTSPATWARSGRRRGRTTPGEG